MSSSSSLSMNRWAAALLLGAGAASAATGIQLWCQGDWLLPTVLWALALALVYRSSRYLNQCGRGVRLCGTGLGILIVVGFIAAPQWTDRGSSWNEAARAARILQHLVSENENYALAHRGSFARRVGELTGTEVVGQSYTIVYSPIEDADRVIRHYSLRAVPLGTYWIRLYADETGVIRHNDAGPADRKSPPFQ
jgi:hypothetical protein